MIELPPAPRMTGSVLRTVVAATRAEPVRRALTAFMRKDLGIEAARALPATWREEQPLDALPLRARDRYTRDDAELGAPESSPTLPSALGWQERYRAGTANPVEVTERFFAEARRLADASPSMNCLCASTEASAARDAEASAARWRDGRPLGPLDGVIVPIKEELDIAGVGYRLGTAYIAPDSDVLDATCVAHLRAQGAIIVGHTPMTEMGMSPLGGNIHRDMPRNAHARDRLPGGSSTGSGVAVGCGLAPVALGTDGGGSIRIPAAFNGVFGIKPTFGRVSRTGDGFGGTVDHLGPIGASSYDLAVFLEVAGARDPEDPITHAAPAIEPSALVDGLGRGVRGLRIGILEGEIDAAHPSVQRACRDALSALEKEGAELVRIDLELAVHAAAIGYMTIGLESYASLLGPRREHWDAFGPDLQLLCQLLREFDADDYLDAQCLRAALRVSVSEILREVDVLAMPTTADVAPVVSDDDMTLGFADTPALAAATRFAFLGNLTGLPAGTAPVGSGDAGLPVGLQIVADAYDEATVLSVLAHLERMEVAKVRAPRIAAHPLGKP